MGGISHLCNSMKICIATPAAPGSRKGNRITALRWAGILESLGHRVKIMQECQGRDCEVLVALHARKSYASIRNMHHAQPNRPLIVALTGTDLYGDIRTSKRAQESLELATRLVVLQRMGVQELPVRLRRKTCVIHQSVEAPNHIPPPLRSVFEVCVLGHLRAVKDPFRAAMAVRRSPSSSRIRITHVGGALSEAMARRAREEARRNPRYRWLGELPRWKAIRILARSRILVLSSRTEGGANAISEAIVVGTPVVASRISGSVGLLGADYPGYFEFGDTRALCEMLARCETDRRFYDGLRRCCERLAPLFEPRREREAWRRLLAEVWDE